jgi:hypothetical protein
MRALDLHGDGLPTTVMSSLKQTGASNAIHTWPILAVWGVRFPAPHLSAIPFTIVHELGSLPPERQFPYSMLVRHVMPRSAPAANVTFVGEAISGLQRLQREMARLSRGDENYERKKRALQTAIQELRKMIPTNASP